MAFQRKPEEPKKGAPEYMNTYGDMVTLLLCFFVLLYSMSSLDAAKFNAMAAALSGNVVSMLQSGSAEGIMDMLGSGIMDMPAIQKTGPSTDKAEEDPNKMENNPAAAETVEKIQAELAQMASDFKTYFAENQMNESISTEVFENYIRITITDNILFDRGRANLRPEVIPVLDAISAELVNYIENDIKIEGHSDTDPINSPQFKSNWWLSAARAITVAEYFVNEKGLDPARVSAEGMGEFRPIAPNDTEENKAKNRRVEIKVFSSYVDNMNGNTQQ